MKMKTVTVQLQNDLYKKNFLDKFCTYFMFLSHFMYVKPLILYKDLKKT